MTVIDPAHPKPVYEPDELTAKAGTVAFFLANVPEPWAGPDHDFLIGPSIGKVLVASPSVDRNDALVFTVEGLTPGSYVFWCSIVAPDGVSHASRGMVGTLTITP